MTAGLPQTPPDLEERFREPEGWRWHSFRNAKGRTLRFGTVPPKSRIPDAVVIGLPGLSEFSEKYFEIARDLLGRNLSFWVLDWQGQGHSHRHLKNPHRRYSEGFDADVADLHFFIMEYVKHAAVHPDVGRIPMVMLAHSMGANIGLRYLHDHPGTFTCAALVAPLLGIKAFSKVPLPLGELTVALHRAFFPHGYVYGGGNWTPDWRKNAGKGPFSSDPERDRIHNAWMEANPSLQAGSVTFRWLYEALASNRKIHSKGYLESIETPCLLAAAGRDIFVDNKAIAAAAGRLKNGRLLELPESFHEVLMESDEHRAKFFEAFDRLVKEQVIDKPETLKPF